MDLVKMSVIVDVIDALVSAFLQQLLELPSEEDDEAPQIWVSFFKPNMTINLVDDFTK